MTILSIIIPVYKAEKWIATCLESVIGQIKDKEIVEVICVNDGSPDNSSSVVDQYKKKLPNLRLIEQDNKGVSAARNRGIQNARGKFLLFLDSDDVLFDGSVEKLIALCSEREDNIIILRMFQGGFEQYKWQDLFTSNSVYSAREVINQKYLHGSSCGCVFKRQFVEENNIHFPEGVFNGEDGFFFYSCLYYSGQVLFNDIKLYGIIGEESSLSRSFTKDRIDRMIRSIRIVDEELRTYPFWGDRRFVLNYIRYSLLSGLVFSSIQTGKVGFFAIAGVKKYCTFELNPSTSYLRPKMMLMSFSLVLFYLFAWIKNKMR